MNQDYPGNGSVSNEGRPSATPANHAPAGRMDDRTRVQGVARPASPPPKKGGPRKKKKARGLSVFRMVMINILKAVFVMFCLGLMVASVMAVQMVQFVVAETNNDDNILDLDNIKLNQTSYIMILNPDNPKAKEQEDWIEYQELIGDENRIWVPLDQIPEDLVNAAVATEDREFYNHHGISFKRTIYAGLNEVFMLEDTTFGASTIDQQLVKNLTGDDEVVGADGDKFAGYKRKVREMFRAWGLNNNYGKDMIMEAYLNTMGLSERIAGVQAGALEYFGKEVKDLTLAECATIAGITQSPGKYSPYSNPENCKARRDDVIQFMTETGAITQAQAQEAWDTPLNVKARGSNKSEAKGEVFSYVSDMVFESVVKDLMAQGGYSTRDAAVKYIYNGGLRIYATADLKVQRVLEDMYLDGYDDENGFFTNYEMFHGYSGATYKQAMTIPPEQQKDKEGNIIGTQDILPQSSAVVMNYDGELVAIVGGIGPKTQSLTTNRAYGTLDKDGNPAGYLRQVGSVMKPLAAYALGIDQGFITYSKGIQDTPVLANPYGTTELNWPSNYSTKYRHTSMPVVMAIAESTNTVAAQVGLYVGRENMFEHLTQALGITTLSEKTDMDIAPLVLGSMTWGMSAYELAGAYTVFGGSGDTYGSFTTLHTYTQVTDSKGNLVLEPEISTVQAIDNESGYVMNRLLSNVLRGNNGVTPTGTGMAPEGEMDSVAKTGTTSDDRDRWFVGLTPYYVTAVWWGYDSIGDVNFDMKNKWPPLYVNIPPNVWKSLMENVQKDMEFKEFPPQPEGIVEGAFCAVSGDLIGPYCPRGGTGYYTSTNTPSVCTGHTAPADPAAEPAA